MKKKALNHMYLWVVGPKNIDILFLCGFLFELPFQTRVKEILFHSYHGICFAQRPNIRHGHVNALKRSIKQN